MEFLLQLVGECEEPRRKPALAGLEDPSLGVGERGEVPGGPFLEGLLQGVESGFDLGGGGSERRGAHVSGARLGAPRVPHERLSGGGVGRQAVGDEERLRLASGEGVTRGGFGQAHLGRAVEGAELRRHGHRKAAAVESEAELRGEPPGEGEPALDPGLLPAEKLGDGRRGELVVIDERRHHASLVHRPGGPSRRVRRQDPGLHGDAGHGLNDDRDLLQAVAVPADQALESVDHLEAAIRSRRYPDRHGREVGLRVGALAAQRGERGPQCVDGDEEDKAHRRRAWKGRIWWSGKR